MTPGTEVKPFNSLRKNSFARVSGTLRAYGGQLYAQVGPQSLRTGLNPCHVEGVGSPHHVI
jgi:hypothetical protein